jgi:hypothetical protein
MGCPVLGRSVHEVEIRCFNRSEPVSTDGYAICDMRENVKRLDIYLRNKRSRAGMGNEQGCR